MGRFCQRKLLSQATVEFLLCSTGGFPRVIWQEVVFEQGEEIIAYSLVGTRFAPPISILMSEGDTWVGKVLNEGLVDENNCSSSVAPDFSLQNRQHNLGFELSNYRHWKYGAVEKHTER